MRAPTPGGKSGQPDGSQAQEQVESEDAGLKRAVDFLGEGLNGGEQERVKRWTVGGEAPARRKPSPWASEEESSR